MDTRGVINFYYSYMENVHISEYLGLEIGHILFAIQFLIMCSNSQWSLVYLNTKEHNT